MQPSLVVLLAALGLPFVGAAATPLVHRVLGERTAYFAAAVAAACFGLLASQYEAATSARPAADAVGVEWIPALDVSLQLYLDGLALLVGFLASGIGVLVFVYSAGYMRGESGLAKYYATLLAFMGSMLGVALAADLVSLFVFWELTSITSFLLIGFHARERASQYAARKAMLITVSGGLFMLVGFLLFAFVGGQAPGLTRTFALVGTEGSLVANAGAVREALSAAGLFVPVLALVAVGAATKSAQVPFHLWLPNAMEAPTPVSAFLHSATMVKAGVYLVGRFRPLLLPDLAAPEWTLLFATLGLVTMTVTAILAVGATDVKELLAYSTASHLGLVVAGYGLSNVYGAEAGAFHILNHALFKAALFMVAGIVAHEAGTRAIDELGGLAGDLPLTAAVTGVAAIGMAGIPPFNGFYSKELLFEGTYHLATDLGGAFWLLPVVAVFGSVFTVLYSLRFLWLFLGERPSGLGHVHRPPVAMVAPPVLLATLAGVVGLGGLLPLVGVHLAPVESFVGAVAASSTVGELHGFSYHLPTELSPYALMSAVTVALGLAAFPAYDRLHDGVRRLAAVPVTSPNWYYDGGVAGANALSAAVAARVHSGLLREYAYVVLAAVSVLTLAAYAAAGAALPALAAVDVVSLPIAVVLLAAVVGAVAVNVAPSHVAGVLTLSILGFMVAVFFVLASAPDLALTQLVVETLVLVIFLLVLDQLPAFYGSPARRRAAADAVLSVVVGATVFVTVLLSTGAEPDKSLAHALVERAPLPTDVGHDPVEVIVEYGGGGNVVNVVLVDFRAFDTLGEISVVAMAALAVLTLVAMRDLGERSKGGPGTGGGDAAATGGPANGGGDATGADATASAGDAARPDASAGGDDATRTDVTTAGNANAPGTDEGEVAGVADEPPGDGAAAPDDSGGDDA